MKSRCQTKEKSLSWAILHFSDVVFSSNLVYLCGDLDDVRACQRKAERAAALIYAHFRKEYGFPIQHDAEPNN